MKRTGVVVRLSLFTTVMVLVLAGLVVVFGQIRFDDTTAFRALFTSVSGLKSGEFVRVAGVEVGKVSSVTVTGDNQALVAFDVDSGYAVTTSTTATVRYQNLVGDRYLELAEQAGDAEPLGEDGTIAIENTSPAIDLDQLLGGFKPLFTALDPVQVNNLSAELIATLQGEGGTVASVLAQTASLTGALADRDAVIGQVITNLNTVLGTLSEQRELFGTAVDRAQDLATGLAQQSQAWGQALASIDTSAATVADLLTEARPPLQDTVAELGRTAAQLDAGKETVGSILTRLPDTYAALSRLGSYGNFFNYYLCGLKIKIDTPDGNGFTTPIFGQDTGRCAPK
jgi:phospholipid/cholesterol/gamma-HCH transport system substrate-binding protein